MHVQRNMLRKAKLERQKLSRQISPCEQNQSDEISDLVEGLNRHLTTHARTYAQWLESCGIAIGEVNVYPFREIHFLCHQTIEYVINLCSVMSHTLISKTRYSETITIIIYIICDIRSTHTRTQADIHVSCIGRAF